MSTTEQPENQPLTRKQLREIRTAATMIVTADQIAAMEERSTAEGSDATAPEPVAAPFAAVPLARPAAPVDVAPAPAPDATVDLGVTPLTRRQARQQELIRTASVPVLSPDLPPESSAEPTEIAPDEPVEDASDATDAETSDAETSDTASAPEAEQVSSPDTDQDASDRPTVNPALGSDLLADTPAPVAAQPSFDQLLTREASATGSVATPNALILTQTPESPIMAPVAATGEILITGSFALPDGLGSQGHAHGTTDGKEVDAVLIDGELPAHSSPTPIAASAAVSTVKTTGDIIRPPAPEKGNRLMLTLAITAGVLALALVGLFVVAWATGVFQ